MERSSAINFAKISDIFGKHDERLMNKFMYLGFALKKNNKSIALFWMIELSSLAISATIQVFIFSDGCSK